MEIQKIVRDWYIKGLQINRCYASDWAYIKSVFAEFSLDINKHGPIITMNEVRNVKVAKSIAQTIARNDLYSDFSVSEIFLTVLRAFPIYSGIVSKNPFEDLLYHQNPLLLAQLMGLQGTIKNTDELFVRNIRNIVHPISIEIKVKR